MKSRISSLTMLYLLATALVLGYFNTPAINSVQEINSGTTVDTSASQVPPNNSVTFTGHGWGDGVGMGQWGALGYALAGYSYTQILSHFYGGTTLSKTSVTQIRVAITQDNGAPIDVTSSAPFTVAGISYPADMAAKMLLTSTGQWDIFQAAQCGSTSWTTLLTIPASQASKVVAVPSDTATNAPISNLLKLCLPSSSTTLTLRGTIEGVNVDGSSHAVNIVPLQSYLQGVVPAEMPSGWANLGSYGPQNQALGFQALEAQAVAARSYAVSTMGSYGYADICDTSACQDYLGATAETALSNLAVADTASQVLISSNGSVATTFYSASTGGYTAGGPFPAVIDTGDSVCTLNACNPNHTWEVSIPVSTVQSAYPNIGTLESIQVTKRNNLGDFGGRVLWLNIVGSTSTTTTTGASFAYAIGLKSNWFEITDLTTTTTTTTTTPTVTTTPPTTVPKVDGYIMASQNGGVFTFGNTWFAGSAATLPLAAPVTGIASMQNSRGYWLVGADGGVFSFGDASFYGSLPAQHITPNAPIVAIVSTPNGGGYWLVGADGGVFSFGNASFYGSLPAQHITPNAPIVAIVSTPNGGGYWLVGADGGVFSFGDASFYGSLPAQHITPNAPIVAIVSTPNGGGYWLAGADGGVFSFGDASFYGSLPTASPATLQNKIVAISATATGYVLFSSKGEVYTFGNEPDLGNLTTVLPDYAGTVVGATLT
ncbi:MAG: SpoIID/LytB domain-containing protein [Actinobacteria bacterium]|nr:SpoIID/LytB domain-containing protein [Actinomycetota bacterium]MCL6104795.1 SpoIID/LytB domain-containing protein [Actinomycetota bacterium]